MSRDADYRAALALFERLRDLDPSARAEALAETAPTEPVRVLLQRLLAADGAASPLLDTPPVVAPGIVSDHASASTGTDDIGQRIGRWQLTGLLGRGGMSVVYRARSLQPPLGQEAALKRLALPAPDAAAMARFEREMAILVRLRHPAIAPLLDAGIDADGLPWFAMGLVEGEPIDRWADRHGLDTAGRLRLCLQACEAVAHAHRHLVVHRDIKPGNVLVDGEGRVVLLDFGISRVLEEGESAQTSSGSYAFTPRYAAPEQRGGGIVSTATDVYGLGALLHTLLLRRPVDLAEGEDAPRLPGHGLAPDLAAILRRALARDPAQRYPGAEALAADIAAFLEGRPVQARRGGRAYQLRRFVGRHRIATALAVALVLSIGVGASISVEQARHARDQAARAEAVAASLARQSGFLRSLLAEVSPSRDAAANIPRAALLEAADARARQALGDDPPALAGVLDALAEVHATSGAPARALALLEEAAALQPMPPLEQAGIDLLGREARRITLAALHAQDHDHTAAVESLAVVRAALAARFPGSPSHMYALSSEAGLHLRANRTDAAMALLSDALVACPAAGPAFCLPLGLRQADTLWNAGRAGEALASYQTVVEAAAQAPDADAEVRARAEVGLARALLAAGRAEDARGHIAAFLARHQQTQAGPTRTWLQAMQLEARLLDDAGEADLALVAIEEAIDSAAELMGPASIDALTMRVTRARMLRQRRRIDEALAEVESLLPAMSAARGASHPATLQLLGLQAQLLQAAGRLPEAIQAQRAAVDGLAAAQPAGSLHLARERVVLARMLAAGHDLGGAEATLALALPAYLDADGQPSADGLLLAAERALLVERHGRREEAMASLSAALDGLRRHPEGRPYAIALAWSLDTACRAPALPDCGAYRDEARAALAADHPAQRAEHDRLHRALGND